MLIVPDTGYDKTIFNRSGIVGYTEFFRQNFHIFLCNLAHGIFFIIFTSKFHENC